MKRFASFVFAILIVTASLSLYASAQSNPEVVLETSYGGDIVIELFPDVAPITVDNFLNYVNSGFYNGLLFHRVIENFMVQGGGYYYTNSQFYTATTDPPIINESTNGLSNLTGTVAMARQPDPDTATSQFFINHADNIFLDRANASDGYGYCVFGQVTEGLAIVNAIAQAPWIDAFPSNPSDPFNNLPYPMIGMFTAYVRPAQSPSASNFFDDDQIDFKDFSDFAARWFDDCNSANSFCNGTDLDFSGTVDTNDLAIHLNNYLQPVTP